MLQQEVWQSETRSRDECLEGIVDACYNSGLSHLGHKWIGSRGRIARLEVVG